MRILVTGAGRAIGAATARELAERGHHVVASARDVGSVADLPVAQKVALDVVDGQSVAAAHAAAGPLDAIVNNAAVNPHGPLEDFPLDRLEAAFATNAVGALRVLQPVLAAWRARGSGVVVNVSSVQGKVAVPLEGAYSASKHALEALSDTLHYELAHFGIRVVVVEPGYVSPGMKAVDDHRGPAVYDELRAQWAGADAAVTGIGGRSTPETVARAIADAIEDPGSPRRVEVGGDAQMVLGTHRELDDAGFEAAMREVLGLTW